MYYTTVNQSKKLLELGLDPESADMYYPNRIDIKYQGALPIEYKHGNPLLSQEIPCWSLAALLSVLPMVDFTTPQLIGTPKTLYRCMYNDNLKSPACDNAVDACVEMILKLHELNLL